jgi:hypothetical protein
MLPPNQGANKPLFWRVPGFFSRHDGFFSSPAQCEVKVNPPELAFLAPPKEKAMAKRGKVLRDPCLGPGLLMVEGKQYPFLMDLRWRSDVPAKPGLVVNVDFDPQGNVNAITAVPHAQLDQEQAELERSNRHRVFQSWTPGNGAALQAAAVGLLMLSWFFLTAISIRLPFFGQLDLTFWQVLGYLNAGSSLQSLEVPGTPDPGIFGFLAILVLAGPFLPFLWSDRRAWLGGLLPVTFVTLISYRVIVGIHASFAPQMAALNAPLQANPHYGILSLLSIGLGTYLSAAIAICLAVWSTKQFLASRHLQERPLGQSQRVAA